MTDLDPKSIDLTLAINFIPAVTCLCKTALIAFSLSVLRPGEHLRGFVVFIMVLNIDRAVSCARIFDENAVQCCILASWVINFLRDAEAPYWVAPLATFFWFCFGFCLVVEPQRVQEFFVMYGHGPQRILPGIFTSLFALVLAFTPLKEEPAFTKSARAVGFSSLCVAWVYVVTVWRPKPRHACVLESHLLLSRFCPILYFHWPAAALYAVGCVVVLVYHYVQIHVSAQPVQPPVQVIPSSQPDTIEEEDEDLEAYFRSACQSRQQ